MRIKEFYACDYCGELPSRDSDDNLGKHVRGFDVKWRCPKCRRVNKRKGLERAQ